MQNYTVRISFEDKTMSVVRQSFSQLCETLKDARTTPAFWFGKESVDVVDENEKYNVKLLKVAWR